MPKVDININVGNDYDDEESMIPGHPPMEGPLAAGSFDFTFFDANSRKVPNESAAPHRWRRVDDWFSSIEKKNTKTTHMAQFSCWPSQLHHYPVDIVRNYYGNSSIQNTTCIEREFSSTNEKQWERMALVAVENRDEHDRWLYNQDGFDYLQADYGGVNVRIQVKTSKDSTPVIDVNPDLLQDGGVKGRMSFTQGGQNYVQNEPFHYTGGFGLPMQRYGLQVNHVGTKSMMHYIETIACPEGTDPDTITDPHAVYANPQPSWVEYAYYMCDWLEGEDGNVLDIFWHYFDTTDTDNYKVTSEPTYGADATNEKFLMPVRLKTPIEVYLVPRAWACHTRFGTTCRDDQIVDGSINGSCSTWHYSDTDINYGASTYYSSCDQSPPPWYQPGVPQAPGPDDPYNYQRKSDCAAYEGIIGTPITGTYTSSNWVDTSDPTRIYGGGVTTWQTTLNTDKLASSLEDNIGLWWASPPIGFMNNMGDLSTAPTETPQLTKKADAVDYAHKFSVEMIADESKETAKANYVLSGGTEEDADKYIVSGYNSYHSYAAAPNVRLVSRFPAGYGAPVTLDTGDIAWRTRSSGKAIHTGGSVTWGGDVHEYMACPYPTPAAKGGLDILKDVPSSTDEIPPTIIGYSEFWDQFHYQRIYTADIGNKHYRPYIDNNLPVGFGVSPAKEGTLVGIVRVSGRPYFVWRKTDEIISVRTVCSKPTRSYREEYDPCFFNSSLGQPSKTGMYNLFGDIYGFDDRQVTGPKGTREFTHVVVDAEYECGIDYDYPGDPWSSVYLERNGASHCWVIPKDGEFELETSVYLVGGQQMYFGEGPFISQRPM